MQALNIQTTKPTFHFPMEELENIESIIAKTRPWLDELERRKSILTSKLDLITRPTPQKTETNEAKHTGTGFLYKGEWIPTRKYIDIHVDLLRKLWIEYPELRCDMAKAMGRFGTTRNYVATSLDTLFPYAKTRWARKYSRRLIDEWLVDTNLNPERMQKILPAAIEVSGLKLNVDVTINWRWY
jgi:hypothetical protein